MPEDNAAYKKIMERLDHIENRVDNMIDQVNNRIDYLDSRIEQISDKMDENYRELKRNYRTLNARLSVLEKKLGHYFSDDEIYDVEIRFPERVRGSIHHSSYEKVDEFGPAPVPRKYYT